MHVESRESGNGGRVGSPKVSICVVTFNQEKYIGQCLQSIVDQDAWFSFEVIVSDDCSTDGTASIILDFSKKYPDLIRPFLHERNNGASANYIFAHRQARGEYIAHVDGDDFLLPGKIQKQADILESDPRCNIVWHKMKVLSKRGDLVEGGPYMDSAALGIMRFRRAEILQFIAIGVNSSKMYRRSERDFELPGFPVVDYYANVEQVGSGYARFVPDGFYGVYRAGVGVSSAGSGTREVLCKCFLDFSKKYPEYRAHVNAAALTYFLADALHHRKSWRMFFRVFLKTFHPKSLLLFLSGFSFSRKLVVRRV